MTNSYGHLLYFLTALSALMYEAQHDTYDRAKRAATGCTMTRANTIEQRRVKISAGQSI